MRVSEFRPPRPALLKSAVAACILFTSLLLPSQSLPPSAYAEETSVSAADPAVRLRNGCLAQLDAKASRGGEIRIVTLGGSITQNAGGHSRRIPDWFQKRYPQSKVTGINAGLSSTCSHSGAFRLQSHVLARAPVDLLVVEFAVNDDQDARHSYDRAVRGMEGIVRRAYSEGIPVLMVLYVNEHLLESLQQGEPAASLRAHLAVAEHYGVPTVNVAAALADAIARGRMTWKQYGGVHPNSDGYAFATGLMTRALAQLLEREGPSDVPKLPQPLDPASYSHARWVSPAAAEFEGAWEHGHPSRELLPTGGIRNDYLAYPLARSATPGSRLRFGFEGNAVGAFVLAGPDAGTVTVRIDGGRPSDVDLFHDPYSKGLNYPRTVILADGLASGKHQLELTVSTRKHVASEGHAVNLLYLGVNDATTGSPDDFSLPWCRGPTTFGWTNVEQSLDLLPNARRTPVKRTPPVSNVISAISPRTASLSTSRPPFSY